jgi:predicted metal-dependent phosphoesterase TrpH
MLIDLHCHTRVYSRCSALTPDALVRAAQSRGLDGVCLTEHDALWPADDVVRLARELSFPVFRGMEVTTEVGHVLVYGVEAFDARMAQLSELRRMVTDAGGVMFLAHPSRRYGTLGPGDLLSMFDGVEAANGTESALQNADAAGMASRMRLPGIGGSDAHSVREVGTCGTRFGEAVACERDFVEALRSGAYSAALLR